ncbi:hypothetical protein D3C79_87120 [compost metagenome]
MTLKREEIIKQIELIRTNVNNEVCPLSAKVTQYFDAIDSKVSKRAERTLAAIVAATASLGGTGHPRIDSLIYGSVICAILLGASKNAVRSALNKLNISAYESSSDKVVDAFINETSKIKGKISSNDFNHIYDYSRILVLGDYKKNMLNDDKKLSAKGQQAIEKAKLGFSSIFSNPNDEEIELVFAKKDLKSSNSSLGL